MAQKIIPAIKWYVNMGSDKCKDCGYVPNTLTVELDLTSRSVTTHYFQGCSGPVYREHEPIPEAVEWLIGVQRQWSEYGGPIGTIIEGLSKYLD